MGIVAIFGAEPLIDRLGGIVDHPGKIVEQAGCPFLAVVGVGAQFVAGLAAQGLDLVADLADQLVGRGPGAAVAAAGDEADALAAAFLCGRAIDDLIGAFGKLGLRGIVILHCGRLNISV